METSIKFVDIVEAADKLSLEEQETLEEVLSNSIREQRRAELRREIQKARQDVRQGKYQHIDVSDLDKHFSPEYFKGK